MVDRPHVPFFDMLLDLLRSLVGAVDSVLLLYHQGRHVVEELHQF